MAETRGDNRAYHLAALAAGVIAIVVTFAAHGGIPGYLIYIAVGVIAAIIGHAAIRRRGPFLWAAIVGLILSYLELIFALGLLTVRLTRIFAG